MTRTNPDKITPEEWRTAAKVARRSIFGNNELADAWDNVAKYSAAADLATQLAKAYIDALHRSGLTHNTWAYLPDAQRTEIRHGMQFVVAHLGAAGRLVPADGMALTAEQVEDVRTMLWSPGVTALDAFRRLRALFPATGPAEATGQDFLDALPTARECFSDYAPAAPAEPAEEETKAEGPCMGGGDMHPCVLSAGHAGVHTDSRGLRWNYPASSPVVPAPTEASVIGGAAVALRSAMALLDPHEGGDWEHAWRTIGDLADCASRAYAAAPAEARPRYCPACKLNVPNAPYCTNCGCDTLPDVGPWPSLNAVPRSVQKVKDAQGYEWHRRGSTDGWRGCKGADAYTSNCRTGHRDSAPFVAAEEG